jgi:hypothetical protein
MSTKPTPRSVVVECSVCGLDWSLHEARAKKAKRKEPTMEDCIALLQAELDRERIKVAPARPLPNPYPVPYPIPYAPHPYPWRRPWRPWTPGPGPIWISRQDGTSAQPRPISQTINTADSIGVGNVIENRIANINATNSLH